MSHLPKKLKIALAAGKILLAVAIIAYLVQRIQRDAGFERLLNEPKHWPFLGLGLCLVLTAFTCSFVRWYLLVRGMGLEFHLRDAFRLGSLGFMLNQAMPGSVGGDLFKAACIAHEQPGRRTQAVASVFIDRVVGLVAMLVVASVALFVAGEALEANALLKGICGFVWLATAGGVSAILLMTSPLVAGTTVRTWLNRVPVIGHSLVQLNEGLANFRGRRHLLLAAFGLAITTHCLLISTFWCVSRGLPVRGPSFGENAAVVPLALVAGALPLTPGGLGITESGLGKLYEILGLSQSDGAMVALGYRALTYVVASIGACYYLSARKRMHDLMIEAEALAEELEED